MNTLMNGVNGIFGEVYPFINHKILNEGHKSNSRNGEVLKFEEFVTRISDPNRPFVGGYERAINPFFLIIESYWIFIGGRDVATLKPYNDRIADYSDDGINFNAPYGWRLRNWGFDSMKRKVKFFGGNVGDQIAKCIHLLNEEPTTRRAVASIWNPDFDLKMEASKDLPCNDMLKFKISNDGKLSLTVFNRSNDLHWGLPTNVVQFSVIGQLVAYVLGLEYGKQTHFSDDLHIYTSNPIADRMEKSYNTYGGIFKDFESIYDFCEPISYKIFQDEYEVEARQVQTKWDFLWKIDAAIKIIFFDHLENEDLEYIMNKAFNKDSIISDAFLFKMIVCKIYKNYKQLTKAKDSDAVMRNSYIYEAVRQILEGAKNTNQQKTDLCFLCVNFMITLMKKDSLSYDKALKSIITMAKKHFTNEKAIRFLGKC